MKKFFFLIMAFALVACVSLTSCSNDDDQPVVPTEVAFDDLFKDGSVIEIAFQDNKSTYDITLKHVDGAMQLSKYISGGIDITEHVKGEIHFTEMPHLLMIGKGKTTMSQEIVLMLDTEKNVYMLDLSEFNVNQMKVNSVKVNGKEFIQSLENITPVLPVPTLADIMDPATVQWTRVVFGPYKGYNQIEIATNKQPSGGYSFIVTADDEMIHDFDQDIRVAEEDGIFFIKWTGEGGIALDSNDNTYDFALDGATLRKVEVRGLNLLSTLSPKPIWQ